jgi:hypothetical protein
MRQAMRAKFRTSGWHMAFALWSKISGWQRRAASQTDSPLEAPCKPTQDERKEREEILSEVPAHIGTTSSAPVVVLGLPAVAALDELFETAGIDEDLGS